ncbi:hypothetical protein Taro_055032 [Colocasia esculenta]|uniref:Aminotransferase-like plant mobile domain-containing protein n=1 Tax=Colocasia esculenta TaxID=4460 RepID=A0A843XSZ0_COLES|nr:hypothetical protein [Colocasia esculenta]
MATAIAGITSAYVDASKVASPYAVAFSECGRIWGEMRARVSWTVVLVVFLAFPPFQRERVEEMGFGEILRMERMRVDPALTQALRSRWDTEATAFVFPWGHMIPSLEDVSWITGLRIYGRPVWAYLHLPALGRGDLARPGLVPIARHWVSRRDTRHLVDQLEHLQEAIDSHPYLDVIWQPYLGEGSEGQPWLVQTRAYFRRSVWLHALNLVLPLNLFLTQHSLGLRQSAVEFPFRDRFTRPGRSFWGLHDTTDWRERAREQIENWECKGKAVKSDANTDEAYLQAYALKYGGKVYKSARHQITSLRALLHSAMQDRETAQRQAAELRSELEKVRSTGAGGASSSRDVGGSPSLLEARLAGVVLRAEEAQRHLEEQERDLRLTTEHAMDLQAQRDQYQAVARFTEATGERDQLRIRAEAAEARVAEMTRELATLQVQGPSADREEVERLRVVLQAKEAVARSL